MSKKRTFECEICGQKVNIDPEDKAIPECCGHHMKEDLPVCTKTETAEHARFGDSGEPCDDGRTGKVKPRPNSVLLLSVPPKYSVSNTVVPLQGGFIKTRPTCVVDDFISNECIQPDMSK